MLMAPCFYAALGRRLPVELLAAFGEYPNMEIILGWLQDRNWRFSILAIIHGETLWPTVVYLLPGHCISNRSMTFWPFSFKVSVDSLTALE